MTTTDPIDHEALHERYRIEREKRLRPDGPDQYLEPTGRFEDRAVMMGTAVNAFGKPEASMGVALGDVDVVAVIDMCPPERFDDYLAFVERHLHGTTGEAFGIAPMGFSPCAVEVDGCRQLFVWQTVTADF